MLSARLIPNPTLYRIHPVSFHDGQGNGAGDYRGLNGGIRLIITLLDQYVEAVQRAALYSGRDAVRGNLATGLAARRAARESSGHWG